MDSEHENQLRKLRRRIEDFIRKCTLPKLIEVADLLGLPVQKNLRNKNGK